MTQRKAPPGELNFDENEDDDGRDIPEDEPRASPRPPSKAELADWLTRRVVAARLGKSTRAINRLVTEGELHPVRDGSTWKFNPKEVADLVNDADQDQSTEIISQLSTALDSSQTQVKQLVSMITTPASVLHELLARENKRLTDRVSSLEDKMIEVIESYEQALTLKHEREIATTTEISRQSRLDKMTQVAMSMLPKVFQQLSGSRTLDQVFDRITVNDLEVMKEAGVIGEKEYETLVTMKQESQPQQAVSNQTEESKESNEHAT